MLYCMQIIKRKRKEEQRAQKIDNAITAFLFFSLGAALGAVLISLFI